MNLETAGLKRKVQDGTKVIIGWCGIPCSFTAEIVARQGFDAIAIDLQHGLLSHETALHMLQALTGTGLPVLCRVPSNDPDIIGRTLDAGFTTIICPMINTKTDAEALVSAVRYPPGGKRSFGPIRASVIYGKNYHSEANNLVTTMAMIETQESVDNLDEILSVNGIDSIYIGPSDLALSLGHDPQNVCADKDLLETIEHIRRKSRKAGKFTGIFCDSPKMAADMLNNGFEIVTLSTDTRIFSAAVAGTLTQLRTELNA